MALSCAPRWVPKIYAGHFSTFRRQTMKTRMVVVLLIAGLLGTGCTLETVMTFTATEAVEFFNDFVQWFRDNPM